MGTLIVVGGPTAVGKTTVAVQLAQHLGTEVISADARQFYHQLRIGAALPTPEEMMGVKHHFIGQLDLHESMSAGAYERAALPVVLDLLHRYGTAILVGGSGLYIDALLTGLDPLPPSDPELRRNLLQRMEAEGLPALVAQLATLDPAAHATIDRQNPQRVLRALEVCLATGTPFSAYHARTPKARPWRTVKLALEVPREDLYARIDQRVARMMEQGLLEEARALLPYRHLNALNTVGYKELFDHFDGRTALQEAITLIQQHTRNYAKRQMTWLRRDGTWEYVAPPDIERSADKARKD
ncbi:MAG: tRNA (adenosine(37)-N6)-dimethylallyltransferase MiaA [Flavobacteriales bacterium]|nr:tRNA (adenosine(37)-N6)-dimethylallyltransferase MiaA [Flavobacteriales bacterium]